jgi:hypothetical protein
VAAPTIIGWHRPVRGSAKSGTDAGLDARVAGVADPDDAAVLDADVGLDDAELRVEDEGVGDDEVEAVGVEGGGRLAHAVADDLAAAELDLVAVAAALGDEVALDLDEQLGVGEADAVARGGAEHLGVLAAGEGRHGGLRGADDLSGGGMKVELAVDERVEAEDLRGCRRGRRVRRAWCRRPRSGRRCRRGC